MQLTKEHVLQSVRDFDKSFSTRRTLPRTVTDVMRLRNNRKRNGTDVKLEREWKMKIGSQPDSWVCVCVFVVAHICCCCVESFRRKVTQEKKPSDGIQSAPVCG